MDVFHGINKERLEEILNGIGNVRMALIGDLSIDIYWKSDMKKSELSRETPHFPLPVVEEYMYPGAGGNAAANIAALKPGKLTVLSVIGRDWRGDALKSKLVDAGIEIRNLVENGKMVTNAYCKPFRKGISDIEYEDPRIDFANYKDLPEEAEEEIMYLLEQYVGNVDVLCVCDQFSFGCITPAIRERIVAFAEEGLKVVVDSRDRIGMYRGVFLKPNEIEGLKVVYGKSGTLNPCFKDYAAAAQILAKRNQAEVCMTLGSAGCLYADRSSTVHIPSYEVQPPIDTCGAGDTFLSAFSCAIAAGAKAWEAASFANMSANVTIRKIGITGTASPDEIRLRHGQILDCCFSPNSGEV